MTGNMTTGTAPKTAQRGKTAGQSANERPPAASKRTANARRPRAGERAAAKVLDEHTLLVTLPDNIGTIRLPEPKRLAFYGGLTVLAAFGVVEWPVAVVLGIGHLLAEDHHHKVLAEFGEALAEA